MAQYTSTPASVVDDGTVGAGVWTTPANAQTEDGTEADCNTSDATHYLWATDFGFAIPALDTITGVSARVKRRGEGDWVDLSVRMLIPGGAASSPLGDEKADTLTNWPSALGNAGYGGDGDDWGNALTPTIVNDVFFGFVFAGDWIGGMDSIAHVDVMELTVFTGGGDPSATFIEYGEEADPRVIPRRSRLQFV